MHAQIDVCGLKWYLRACKTGALLVVSALQCGLLCAFGAIYLVHQSQQTPF